MVSISKKSQRTRAKMLAAVRSILLEQGNANLTMRTVSERAGVDRKLIYFHFGDFESLLKAYVQEEIAEGMFQNLPNDIDSSGPASYLESWLNAICAQPLLAKIVVWELHGDSASLDVFRKVQRANEKQLMEKWRADGTKDFTSQQQAIFALLLGGIQYLAAYGQVSAVPLYGTDLRKEPSVKQLTNLIRDIMNGTSTEA